MSNFRFTRPDNFPPIVKNLILINVAVYVAQLTLTQYHITEKLMLYPLLPHGLPAALEQAGITDNVNLFEPYQIATHMFAHSPITFFHIIFNMVTLWMFGRILENVWGPKRFLTFYLACGIGAALLHLGIQYIRADQLLQALAQHNALAASKLLGSLSPALGASGAIMGVMAAFAYLFPNTELYIMFIPFPIKAKWAVIGMAAIDLFGGVASINGDNIAHFAHLGGAITGLILVLIWNKTNKKTFY